MFRGGWPLLENCEAFTLIQLQDFVVLTDRSCLWQLLIYTYNWLTRFSLVGSKENKEKEKRTEKNKEKEREKKLSGILDGRRGIDFISSGLLCSWISSFFATFPLCAKHFRAKIDGLELVFERQRPSQPLWASDIKVILIRDCQTFMRRLNQNFESGWQRQG